LWFNGFELGDYHFQDIYQDGVMNVSCTNWDEKIGYTYLEDYPDQELLRIPKSSVLEPGKY
jgi:hypothetical protein